MDLRKLIGVVLVVVLALLSYFFFAQKSIEPSISKEKMALEKKNQFPPLKLVDFSKLNSLFRFSGQIPSEFEVEYIPQLKAMSIYNSHAAGDSNREKSQLYISSFEANRFLTLSTVEITQRDETNVQGHDAVLYEITKKTEVPDFPNQPSWRNFKHKALDIRFTQNNPSVFYSFAYNPAFLERRFKDFIGSLIFRM